MKLKPLSEMLVNPEHITKVEFTPNDAVVCLSEGSRINVIKPDWEQFAPANGFPKQP
jgi:uncharacterized protein YlzI (FlbEa/FlbD family)